MANYPPYSPYQGMFQQGYQMPVYQPQTPQQTMQMPQSSINARIVSCREEAVAAQINFDNTPNVFADLSHGMIYVKRFNPMTGCADLNEYKFVQPISEPQKQDQKAQPTWAAAAALDALTERVEKLERMKEEKHHDPDEQPVIPINRSGSKRKEPD